MIEINRKLINLEKDVLTVKYFINPYPFINLNKARRIIFPELS